MNDFFVKINKERVRTDKRVFLALLNICPVERYVSYQNAIINNEIRFSDLKQLALKADVPYPLFFAPMDKIQLQVRDNTKNLFQKIPSKSEMQLSSRGKMQIGNIELIAKDLGRKQEFLKKRVLMATEANSFIGSIARKIKRGIKNEQIAEYLRNFFDVDLNQMRKMPKAKVLDYLRDKIESKGILISFSSHNYMPQNIDKDAGLSGLCIKDKKFPYIFINTRDGDEKPKILESSGRQIFTLITMLVCVGMNRFVLNSKRGETKGCSLNKIFSIVGEFLIPKQDIKDLRISSIDDLRSHAKFFKVTPSMLLVRFSELKLIDKAAARHFREVLAKEVEKVRLPHYKPSQTTGYSKYNGERFSKEIIRAFNSGAIAQSEVKNILFRKGKMGNALFQNYIERFKPPI